MRPGSSLRLTLMVSLALLGAAASAIGQTITWTGPTSGSLAMGSGAFVAFTQPGTYTVTVNGAMNVSVAGVAGGGASGGTTHNAGSGGGGGGAATTGTTVFLVPNKTYTLIVGASGVGTSGDSTGGTGGQTKLTNTTNNTPLVVLNGGVGGQAIINGGAGGTLTTGSNGISGGSGGTGAIGNNPGYNGNAGGNATGGAGGGGGGAYNPTGSIGGDGGSGVVAGHAHNGRTGGTGGGMTFSGVTGEFGGGGAGTAGVESGATVGNNGQSGAAVVSFVSSCAYSLSPASINKPATAISDSIAVTAAAGCSWTATSDATWLTITSGASGSGAGTINYAVAANTSGIARVGHLTVIDQTANINQATDTNVSPVITWTGTTNGSQTMNQVQTLPFTTVGTYTMTVNHAMTLSLAAVAGGGASGGTIHNAGSGGGGGGAATTGTTVSLIPGKTYTLTVGTRGLGTAGDSTGGAGAATTFFNTTDSAAFVNLNGGGGGQAIINGGSGGTLLVGSNGVTGGVGGIGGIGNNPNYNGNAGGNASGGAAGGGGGGYNPTGTVGGDGGNGGAAGHAHSGRTGGAGGGMTFAGVSGEYGAGGGGTTGVESGATTGNPGQNGAAVFTFLNVCDYNLSSTSVIAPRSASTGLISLSTISTCSWAATSNTSWLTIKSGASGSGTGTVTFATTTNATGLVRSGTLIVANQLVVVTQLASSSGDPTPLLSWTGPTSGSQNVRATPTVPFTAAGTYTMNVNVGMNLTFVGVAGGGASGGTMHNSGTGGGGGGGATTGTSVSLLPDKTYTLVVGAGGAGTGGDSTGGTGQATSLTNTTNSTPLVVLNGGAGGMAVVTGGAGGTLNIGTNGVTGGGGGAGGAGSNPSYNGNVGGNAVNGAGGGGGGAYNPNGAVGGEGGNGSAAGHAHNGRFGGTGGGMTFAGVSGDFGGGGGGASGIISGASTGSNGQNGAGVLTYISSIPAAPSAPTTTCSFYFSSAAAGLRSHTWTQSDCSNGLPLPTWTGVGQAQNGNGTSGQALCTPTTGSHNNPLYAGSTDASITCFFGPPTGQTQPDPSVTTCSFSFTGSATGWRTHTWVAADCSNGLPQPNAVGLGYGQNAASTGGTVDCSVSTGSHFNHPTNDGSTTGTVSCTFVNPSTPATPKLTFCEHFFPDTANGWRTYTWTAGDCSNELPTPGAWAIGQALNADGTPEQAYCSSSIGGHFNSSASTGRVRCLFENLLASSSAVLSWAGPTTGWQDMTATPVLVLTAPGPYAVNVDTSMALTFYGAAGGAGGGSGQNGNGYLIAGNGGAGGGGGAVTNGTSVTLIAGKNYQLAVGAGGPVGGGGFPTSLINLSDNLTMVSLNGGGALGNIATGGAVVVGSNGAAGGNGGSAGVQVSGLATAGGNGANQVLGAAGGGGGGTGDTGSGGSNAGGMGGRGSGDARAQAGSLGSNGSGVPGTGGAGAVFSGIPGTFGGGGGAGGGGNQPNAPGGAGGAGQLGVGIFSKNPLGTLITAGAVTPEVGSGLNQTFSFQYGDTAGATDLATVGVLFHPTIPQTYANTCYASYTRATNTLSLTNDAGTGVVSGLVGTGGTIQNSQCSINLSGGSASTAGSTLTLTLPMTFTTAFQGVKNIYLSAANATQQTGWQNRGGWTVPLPACVFSLSPQSATFSISGGAGQVNVSAQSWCGWQASTPASWIHITAGSSGTGNGTTSYSVDTNFVSSQRVGTISIAGITFTVTQLGMSDSVLKFHTQANLQPSAQVLVSYFGEEDVTSGDGVNGSVHNYDQRSSLQQAVSQGSPSTKTLMRNDFSDRYPSALSDKVRPHPHCPDAPNPNLVAWSYVKPYTWDQEWLKNWLHDNAPVSDILPPLARKNNHYEGDQQCPQNASSSNQETFGYAVSATPNLVQFSIDNTINPWRWSAPINSIHPVEQPSFAVVSHVDDVLSQTQTILSNFRHGVDQSKHILLDYDVDFTVYDAQEDLGELGVLHIYERGIGPCAETTLPGLTVCNAITYGPSDVISYEQKRLGPPTIQLSLTVNFREFDHAYILNDFMLSSFNYLSTISNATTNATINPYIFEGGTNVNGTEGVSWHRLRVDALQLSQFNPPGYALTNGEVQYVPIEFDVDHHFHVQHSGTIDLTNFYLVANQNNFFPGQNGPNGPFDSQFGEQSGINWAGVILESHGPFVTTVKVNKFNIRTQ